MVSVLLLYHIEKMISSIQNLLLQTTISIGKDQFFDKTLEHIQINAYQVEYTDISVIVKIGTNTRHWSGKWIDSGILDAITAVLFFEMELTDLYPPTWKRSTKLQIMDL